MSDDQNVEESTDQPPVEESTDQPETEESEESTLPESKGEETEEESSDDLIEVNGEKLTLDEIKAGYMRQSDYTKKTQEVSSQRKEIEDMKTLMADMKGQKEISPEQKQVFDFIAEYGLVTSKDLEKQLRTQQAKMADLNEFTSWKQTSSIDPKTADAVFELGKAFPKMSYKEIHQQYFGHLATTKKVVKRKVVGVKGKGASDKSSGGYYTREKIAELVKSGEYDKHRDKILAQAQAGKIK